ncbi:MAG: ParB/RepB/Spo0J family partition protein [Planctomycetota bacterium]
MEANGMAKKSRLGRGLSTLMSSEASVVRVEPGTRRGGPSAVDAAGEPAPTAAARPPEASAAGASNGVDRGRSEHPSDEAASDGLRLVAVGAIRANPHQPRRTFDPSALQELADSLRSSGMIQPIVVRPNVARPAGRGAGISAEDAEVPVYELVAGERRWRAAQLAGLETIPAIVRSIDDRASAEWALIENVQRADLNAIERARSYQDLIRRFGLTQHEVAERVGLDRSNVANHLRMLDLEEEIQAAVAGGLLSGGHAKALLSAPAGEGRLRLARQAQASGWSVRRLEGEAKSASEAGSGDSGSAGSVERSAPEDEAKGAALRDLERQLGEHLGTKVRVRTSGGGERGRIEIAFYGLDHFDGLLDRLGVRLS